LASSKGADKHGEDTEESCRGVSPRALFVRWRPCIDGPTYITVLDPKTEQYRVPVSKRLRKALDALPVDGPFYFPHRRRATDPRDFKNSVKSMLRRACDRAKIPYGRGVGITFHALRHTGASRMLERGVDIRTVQEIGGWSSLRQLTRYTHPSERAKRAAVELVGRTTDKTG
jgi:integrase